MDLRGARFKTAIFISAIAIFTIAGCGGRSITDKGERVTQKNFLILLKEGDQQGVWKADELALKYKYQMSPGTLDISGTAELVDGFATGFKWIESLAVYLLFLDNQGVIIDNVLIYSTGNHRAVDSIPMVFESKIPVPDVAQTISFAYEGELMGPAAADRTTHTIRFFPARR